MEYNQIAREELLDGRYYIGRGRNGNIGKWDQATESFLVVSAFFKQHVVKYEGYFELVGGGCFQPFLLIEEGELKEPFENERGSRYGETLILPEI